MFSIKGLPLQRQEGGEVALMLADVAGNAVQQFALLEAGNEAPIVLRLHGGEHGAIAIFCTSAWHVVNGFFSGGVFNSEGLAGQAVDKLAIDEHFAHWLMSRSFPPLRSGFCLVMQRIFKAIERR